MTQIKELLPADIRELLPAVVLGIATPEEISLVKVALESDAALQAEYLELERVLAGLGADVSLEPPLNLKAKVMSAARETNITASRVRAAPQVRHVIPQAKHAVPRSFSKIIPWVMGGLAAGLTALTVFFVQPQGAQTNATVVAATTDGSIVYANSGVMSRTTPVVLMRANGTKIPIKFVADKECQFKAAVSSDGLSYLLDSANNTVFIIEEKSGELIDRWTVPQNATAMDVVGTTVVVRSSQVALIFRRNQSGEKSMVEARLSSIKNPNANLEAAVIDGDDLYITDQMEGVIHVLSSVTGKKKTQFDAPEIPVSLAVRDGGLWVLEANGVLLKLGLASGQVLEEIVLEGTGRSQYLRLTDDFAFIADSEGFVSVVDLAKQKVTARKRLQNTVMGLSDMPDGHMAVALEKAGIVVLDSNLQVVKTFN
jgi:hypothetical protein